MPDRLSCNSNSIRPAGDHLGPCRTGAVQPMLLRGVIVIAALATPFVAALLAS